MDNNKTNTQQTQSSQPTQTPPQPQPNQVSPDNPFKNLKPIDSSQLEPYQPQAANQSPTPDQPQITDQSPAVNQPSITPLTNTPTPDTPTDSSNQHTPKNNKKIFLIFGGIIAVIILAIGAFIVFKNLTLQKKTLAQFEQTISSIGYTKATNSSLEYSDSDGAFTTYAKGTGNTTDGVAMFYEMQSKEKLQNLVNKELANSEAKALFQNFDWTKDRNKTDQCSSSKPYICMVVSQVDNTLLLVYYHSDSLDEAKSETTQVLNSMNY